MGKQDIENSAVVDFQVGGCARSLVNASEAWAIAAVLILILFASAATLHAQPSGGFKRFEVFGAVSVTDADFRVAAPEKSAIRLAGTTLSDDSAREIQSLHKLFFGKSRILGGFGAFTVNLNRRLGIEVEIGRHSGSRSAPVTGTFLRTSPIYEAMAASRNRPQWTYNGVLIPFEPVPTNVWHAHTAAGQTNTHNSRLNILVGPKLTLRNQGRIKPFIHGLAGVSRMRVDAAAQYSLSATLSSPSGDLRRIATGVLPGAYVLDQWNGSSRHDNNISKSSSTNLGLAFAIGGGVDLPLTRAVSVRLVQLDYILTNNRAAYASQLTGTIVEGVLTYREGIYTPSGQQAAYVTGTITPTGTRELTPMRIEYSTKATVLSNIRASFGLSVRF